MSIAIRVNGRKRSSPPVGPFTVTLTNTSPGLEYASVEDENGNYYDQANDTFTANVIICSAGNYGPGSYIELVDSGSGTTTTLAGPTTDPAEYATYTLNLTANAEIAFTSLSPGIKMSITI